MEIAYGLVAAGPRRQIRIGGRDVMIRSPRDAGPHGIGMVHQHFTSVPAHDGGGEHRAGERAGWYRAASGPSRVLDGSWAGPGSQVRRVEGLSVSLKQRLEIVKALEAGARILLLDEPTAVLAPAEVEELLRSCGISRTKVVRSC